MWDWVNDNINQIKLKPDPPHGINGQCVNLASSWSMAQGGPELLGATAWAIYQNFRHPFYDVIPGTQVQPGDIVFYYPNNAAAGTGPAGHVNVALDSFTATSFRGIDTDWNANPHTQFVTHSYNGIAGVFRPKGELAMTPEVKIVFDDLKAHILNLENQLKVQDAKLEDLKQHIINLENK